MSTINEIKECEYCGNDCYKTGEWICDEYNKDHAEEEELKKNPCYEHYQNGQYYCKLCQPPETECIRITKEGDITAVEYISSDAELSDDEEWEICEICYRHLYTGCVKIEDPDRCDGVYFCTIDCLAISKLKNLYCESCGGKFREDKMIEDKCQACHKHYNV